MPPPLPVAGSPGEIPRLDLGSTYGVMLISTIVVTALFGFTVLQTLYYYEKFPKDHWLMKTTVGLVGILDTLTVVLNAHALYFYLIDNYNNPPALQQQVWSLQAELVLTYTIVLVVQIFFLHHMYHLRPHLWYIPVFLAILAVAAYALSVAVFAIVLYDPKWADVGGSAVNNLVTASWVLGMAVDFGITFILCWYLWSEKGTVRHKTSMMLSRIIIFLVHRGAIAAVVQVLTLLTKITSPQTLLFMAFHNALSKVYANSMLATLNARVSLRKMVMSSELDLTKGSTFSQDRPVSSLAPLSVSQPFTTLQFAHDSAFDSTGTARYTAETDDTGPYPGSVHSAQHSDSAQSQRTYDEDKYNGAFFSFMKV